MEAKLKDAQSEPAIGWLGGAMQEFDGWSNSYQHLYPIDPVASNCLEVWSVSSNSLSSHVTEGQSRVSLNLLLVAYLRVSGERSQNGFVDGRSHVFPNENAKFEALVEAWMKHNAGRSKPDYLHLSHLQIIGMGDRIIPRLLERVAQGNVVWVYALKCISGG